MKQSRLFTFEFILNNRVNDLTRPRGFRFDDVAKLEVSGTIYHRPGTKEPYQADIDFVKWNGVNIKPILVSDQAEGFYSQIQDAAIQHAEYRFSNPEVIPDEEPERSPLFKQMANICRAYNKAINGL